MRSKPWSSTTAVSPSRSELVGGEAGVVLAQGMSPSADGRVRNLDAPGFGRAEVFMPGAGNRQRRSKAGNSARPGWLELEITGGLPMDFRKNRREAGSSDSASEPGSNAPASRRRLLGFLVGSGVIASLVSFIYPILEFILPPTVAEMAADTVAAQTGELLPGT